MESNFWKWFLSGNSWYLNFWPITRPWDHLGYASTCGYLKVKNPPAWERMKIWRWILWAALVIGWSALFIPSEWATPVNIAALVIFLLLRFWWKIPGAKELHNMGPENRGQMIGWTIIIAAGGFIQSRVFPIVLLGLFKFVLFVIPLFQW